ncbi:MULTISPECIES: hypothetical protein [Burkholderia cepacia complex]|uniref:hypothetical protein n=1 Tax=Burkholderia cenocepacia TaxID=95486 RepID=UPI002237D846|nr:hypothetical protein [Burkholderia cenocepacia]MCW5156399.1 hypothetical protein [Burkholderia cenocepacia]
MNKNFGTEFFVSMLFASLSYLFGFMLLKNCIEPLIAAAQANGNMPMTFGNFLAYSFFVCNIALSMFVFMNTGSLLKSMENNDKIYE